MAYTKEQFLRELAIYTTAGAIGLKNTGRFLAYAGKKGINLAGLGARKAAVPATRGISALIRRNPFVFGALTLYEAEQMGLLDPAKEAALDVTTSALERGFDFLPQQTPEQMFQGLDVGPAPTKKKPTKYNKAVAKGMAAAKASKYFGKKGTISKPQSAFKTVNSVASRLFGKKKVANTGSKGVIARAIRRSI